MARFVDAAPDSRPWRIIHRVADQHLANFVGPFLASIESLRRRVTDKAVDEAMERGLADPQHELVALLSGVVIAKQADPERLAQRAYAEVIVASVTEMFEYVQRTQGERAAELIGSFNITSPFVLRAAEVLTANLVTGITRESQRAIRRIIFNAIRDGLAPRDSAKLIRDVIGLTERQALAVDNLRRGLGDRKGAERTVERYSRRLLKDRALNIARTETMRASNRGQQLLWDEMVKDGLIDTRRFQQRWLTTPDDRLCPRCAPMNGQVVALGGRFNETERGVLPSERVPFVGETTLSPPLHPRCFPAEQLVEAIGIRRIYRRWYVGPMVKVWTAAGQEFTSTPNHPILTDAGWVAAGLLDEGDSLVHCTLGQNRVALINPDVERGPTQIGELFDTAATTGLKQRIRGRSTQFHGDGRDGEVEIITIDRKLLDWIESSSLEQDEEKIFTPTGVGETLSGTERLADLAGVGMGGGRERCSFVGSCPVHSNKHGFTAVTRLDISFEQTATDDGTTDPKGIGQRLFRFAGEITSDKVIRVERVAFHDWVYNLESVDGWYIADCIIVGNCRCVVVADIPD